MRKKAFQAAFPYTIPIFAGFWFLALAYGIYMNANGFPFVYPMLMSLLIYGGSLEFVAVEITKEPKAKTFRRTVSIPHFLTQRIKALRRERLKYRTGRWSSRQWSSFYTPRQSICADFFGSLIILYFPPVCNIPDVLSEKHPPKTVLRQHRTIRQEVSDRIFLPIQSSENGGILYVPARGMPHP